MNSILFEIAFDNNQITILKKNYFSNYTVLRVLSLSKNHITTIEMGALPSTGSLEVLNINNNYLDCNTSCFLQDWNNVWETVSLLAKYNADRNISSIDSDQQCLCTAANEEMSTTIPRADVLG
ncbi:protein artichoke-like [Mytilus trossulus]|uniref:protein artichoke-like n=1 Tax=Mytilus trossulus TaxID=6551 RepID=UPI003007E6CB